MTLPAVALIAVGLIYLAKPDVFRRWFWLKTSLAIRHLSEAGYRRYMRVLGCVFILAGIGMIVWEQVSRASAG
jgi:hypothetical protein